MGEIFQNDDKDKAHMTLSSYQPSNRVAKNDLFLQLSCDDCCR